MRKISRTVGGVVLAAVLAAAPAAALHARPAEDTGRSGWEAFDRLHDLLRGLELTRLWAGNASSPSFDPNGNKAKMRTAAPTDRALRGEPADRRPGPKPLRAVRR